MRIWSKDTGWELWVPSEAELLTWPQHASAEGFPGLWGASAGNV